MSNKDFESDADDDNRTLTIDTIGGEGFGFNVYKNDRLIAYVQLTKSDALEAAEHIIRNINNGTVE